MNYAIILSGGVGSRMGLNLPKQYSEVNGHPIISYCLRSFLNNERINELVIVVADSWRGFVKKELDILHCQKQVHYAQPGETRQFSIYNALLALEDKGAECDDIIIIHDAARPLVSHTLIESCLDGCEDYDGVMPVIPVKDTIYLSQDGAHINKLLDRSQLWAGQAPESFRFGKYLQTHKKMRYEELLQINGSTEIAFKNGLNCRMIQGDPLNFKITTPEDMVNFKRILDYNLEMEK